MRKTVLITGCSSGIGRECAKLFASKGWNVIATMRRPENETELNKLPNISVLPLDVTNEESIRAAIQQTLNLIGSIDVVVNNAGYGAIGPLEAASYEQVFRQFDTNVFGIIRVVQAVLPHFRETRGGLIINVSSVGEAIGMPFGSLYHSSKWALGGLTESLMYELAPFNIRVKLVLPTPVKTDFFDRSMDVLQREGLHCYDAAFAGSFYRDRELSTKNSIPAQVIALEIYKAASDGSKKLRYPVGQTKTMLRVRRFLPAKFFYSIIRSMFMKKMN